MKKRLLALTVVLAMAMALVVPSAFANVSSTPAGGIELVDAGTLTSISGFGAINDSLRVKTVSSNTSYAVVKAGDFTETSKKISWKTFKDADIAPDGYVDLNKIITGVKEASYLLLADGLTADEKKYKSYASVTSITGKVAYYTVAKAGDKPAKEKLAVTYVDTATGVDAKFASVTAEDKFEYTKANDVNGWQDLTVNATVPVEAYAQEYWVRAKGVSGTAPAAPSAYISVKISALTAAPVLKLDYAKGEVSGFKQGMVVSEGATTGTVGSIKKATVASGTSVTDTVFTVKKGSTIEYRVPSGTKPGSAIVQFTVDNKDTNPSGGIKPSYFTMTAKSLKVNGGAPIQVKTGEKWKTVKEIKPDKTTGYDDNGYTIRFAGSKTAFPGQEYTLKVDDKGVVTVS